VYDFPNTLGISRLYQRDWAYSENRRMAIINPTNIALSTTPVFLSEDSTIVSPPLAAFFSNAQKACPVLTVQYRDTSAHATSVLWRFSGGNPATSTARNPTVQYAKSGKYDVVLEVHNAQGVHENRKIEHVEVDSVPKADFDFRYDSARLKLVFTNTSRNSFSMIWDFGDGSPQVFSLHATHTFAARRTYTVRLIAFNACGQDTIYKTIDTRVTSVFEKTPELVGFQSFPNPFGTDFSVQFDLAKAAYLQFDLVDITGRLVQNLSPMRFYTEGGQMATFTPIDLPNGLYFLQIKKEGQGVILVKRLCKYGD
jgi:PKD repeat protein